MSVQSEITRIQTDRNTIRTKLNGFSLVELTADLDDCASAIDNIVDRGTPAAEIREGDTYTINAGYYHGGTVTGVAGGGSYSLQEKSATPTKSEQVISPDSGKYGLSKVTVAAIPAAYQDVTSVTATATDVLATKVFVDSTGAVIAGTMSNRGTIGQTLDLSTDTEGVYNNTTYTLAGGYYAAGGTVSIDPEAAKTITPTKSVQNITPASGKVLSTVQINAIPEQYGDVTNTDAVATNILSGKKALGKDASGNAVTLTGTMTNNGAVSVTITGLGAVSGDTSYTIPAGYHNGSGTVSLASNIENLLAAI